MFRLYLFVIFVTFIKSFPMNVNRIKLGDRLIVIDREEIDEKKILDEEDGYPNEGMDMRYPTNVTDIDINNEINELDNINKNMKIKKIIETLENNKNSLHTKLVYLKENKEIINVFDDGSSRGVDLLAGGLKEDLEEFLCGDTNHML